MGFRITHKLHLTFPELVLPTQRTLICPDAPRMTRMEGSWLAPQSRPATKLRAHVPRNRSAPHGAHEGQEGRCGSGLEIQLIMIRICFEHKNLLKFIMIPTN